MPDPRMPGRCLPGLLIASGLIAVATLPLAATAHHYSPVQPGARLATGCTMNFIYEDPGGTLYTGAAGHCYDEAGVPARTDGGEPFGTVVYRIDQELDGPLDVALIEIDAAWHDRIDPAVRHWGGPVGTAAPLSGSTTLHYGHGIGPGNAEPTRPRTGVILKDEPSGPRVQIFPFSFGDSGGPILDGDGRAVGILGEVVIGGSRIADIHWETPMPVMLDHLADEGWDLSVVTAPLNQDVVDRRVAQLEHCLGSPTGPHGCVGSV